MAQFTQSHLHRQYLSNCNQPILLTFHSYYILRRRCIYLGETTLTAPFSVGTHVMTRSGLGLLLLLLRSRSLLVTLEHVECQLRVMLWACRNGMPPFIFSLMNPACVVRINVTATDY